MWRMCFGLMVIGLSALASPSGAQQSELSNARRAVLEVYARHQAGQSPASADRLEAAAILQVERAAKLTTVLRERWKLPVTAAMLDAELERMAKGSHLPGRLRELFHALGANPRLAREALARPVLVERLARNAFAGDPTLRADGYDAEAFDRWWSDVAGSVAPSPASADGGGAATLPTPAIDQECSEGWNNGVLDDVPPARSNPSAVWTGSYLVIWGAGEKQGGRYDPTTDTWTDMSSVGAPPPGGSGSTVWTGEEMVVWGGSNSERTGGRYDPIADAWTPVAVAGAPEGRASHLTVWTGTRMIVWGGWGTWGSLVDGGMYDPATDTWSPISTLGAPSPRGAATAVWAGGRMVIWGGAYGSTILGDGARYDPGTDTWTPMSTQGAPSARSRHTAISTGERMVVWGGFDGTSTFFGDGAQYDPIADDWSRVSTRDAPARRAGHSSVWTGSEMIVWAGSDEVDTYYGLRADGGIYNPATDRWRSMSTVNAPSGRTNHAAVWAGTRMLVWGGSGGDTGGRYDVATDSWSPTSQAGNPEDRSGMTGLWTGTHFLVWGGSASVDGPRTLDSGGRYDPVLDAWTPTSRIGAPAGRSGHSAVWTGSRMIVWGGSNELGMALGTGGSYDPLADTWIPVTITGAPSARYDHSAVWTGSRMIVWGGQAPTGLLQNGGSYDPVSNSWLPTSPIDAPAPRTRHAAVWTGSEMVIWGGGYDSNGNGLLTGGRYEPVTGVWRPTSIPADFLPRVRFSTVWTGSRMIVWGGWTSDYGGGFFRDGRIYDPGNDAWAAVPLMGAPFFRSNHGAVWTGTRMIIWGGTTVDGYGSGDEGGIYDLAADLWTYPVTTGQPAAYRVPAAVWAESMMIVWGGGSGNGGRYRPPTLPRPGYVTLSADKVGTVTSLSWGAVDGAVAYDVVSGPVSALRALGGGAYSEATKACVGSNLVATWVEDPSLPAADDGIWYLARAESCAESGSFDSGHPSQMSSRDVEIPSSRYSCP